MELDEADVVAIEHRAVDGVQRDRAGRDRDAVAHRLAHVQADVRDLWIGVRAPGDYQFVQPLPRAVQRVGHGHARGGHGHVGEAVRHAGVAGRVDRGVRSDKHTSELQSLMRVAYAVFYLQNKTTT